MKRAKSRATFDCFIISVALVGVWPLATGCRSTTERTRHELERSARHYSHFATWDIISNRPAEREWPTNLVVEQAQLLSELRTWSQRRASLEPLLLHPLPKVRTLALGALFVREDPQDLPAIASLLNDFAPTFPLLHESGSSGGGPHPLSELESPQTVSEVARMMVATYLAAAHAEVRIVRSTVESPVDAAGLPVVAGAPVVAREEVFGFSMDADHGLTPAQRSEVFANYWKKREGRTHCASWFLVKINRATRQSSPLQPEYQRDIRRAFSDANILPRADRAWTLLFVRCASFPDLEEFISEQSLVAALKSVAPERLIRFLQRQRATDDPDLWFGDLGSANIGLFESTSNFLLRHARELLRPQDAQLLIACEEQERKASATTLLAVSPWWAAAAAEVANHSAPAEADKIIDEALQRYPLDGICGGSEQSVLMAALWRMRGTSEKQRLVSWFYRAMAKALREKSDGSNHGAVEFLLQVKADKRLDTKELLAALVDDARFEQADWPVLKELIEMASAGLPKPLVSTEEIYAAWPPRGDNQAVLAQWRELLRKAAEKYIQREQTDPLDAIPAMPDEPKQKPAEEFSTQAVA